MFTGIVEDVGQISALVPLPSEQALRLTVGRALLDDEQAARRVARRRRRLPDGDGVAARRGRRRRRAGDDRAHHARQARARARSVNLERPLRLGDRLGGHMVAGHVDAVGHIAQVAPRAEAVDVTVRAPGALLRYVIEKGSIAVDGISLTVNAVDARDLHGVAHPAHADGDDAGAQGSRRRA